jgi:hypothetical protein
MRGEHAVAQGKKGTGVDKTQLAFRCPDQLYKKLQAGTDLSMSLTARVLRALQDVIDLEESAGDRLPELQAAAILERTTLGKVVASLALEALDGRRKKR